MAHPIKKRKLLKGKFWRDKSFGCGVTVTTFQNEHLVVKVQALWRGVLQRRKFEKLMAEARTKAERTRKVIQVKTLYFETRIIYFFVLRTVSVGRICPGSACQ